MIYLIETIGRLIQPSLNGDRYPVDSIATSIAVFVLFIGWCALYWILRHVFPKREHEWHCRVVTFVHAVLICLMCGWSLFFQDRWPFDPNHHGKVAYLYSFLFFMLMFQFTFYIFCFLLFISLLYDITHFTKIYKRATGMRGSLPAIHCTIITPIYPRSTVTRKSMTRLLGFLNTIDTRKALLRPIEFYSSMS